MKAKELIEKLKAMPPDAEVVHLWDGEVRTSIENVYLSKSGLVVTSDFEAVCYSTESRPIDAPTQEEDLYWETPAKL